MMEVPQIDFKELAFEDDYDDDYYMSPEMEAEEVISLFYQKYGFDKIAG